MRSLGFRSLSRGFGRKKNTTASLNHDDQKSKIPRLEPSSPTSEGSLFAKNLEKNFLAKLDPDTAFDMKRYMRDQFEFVGLPSPQRNDCFDETLKKSGIGKKDIPLLFVQDFAAVCMQSKYREMHYSLMSLLNTKSAKGCINPELLPVLEKFNIFGDWWDITDTIAATVGTILQSDRALQLKKNEEYISHENKWMRRLGLIYQLRYKDRTDQELLWQNINRTKHDKDFFIRKAIGWVLREYSKTNPQAVRHFVQGPDGKDLSPLSVKEAMRIIEKKNL